MKFNIVVHFEDLFRKLKCNFNLRLMTGTLRGDLFTFMIGEFLSK